MRCPSSSSCSCSSYRFSSSYICSSCSLSSSSTKCAISIKIWGCKAMFWLLVCPPSFGYPEISRSYVNILCFWLAKSFSPPSLPCSLHHLCYQDHFLHEALQVCQNEKVSWKYHKAEYAAECVSRNCLHFSWVAVKKNNYEGIDHQDRTHPIIFWVIFIFGVVFLCVRGYLYFWYIFLFSFIFTFGFILIFWVVFIAGLHLWGRLQFWGYLHFWNEFYCSCHHHFWVHLFMRLTSNIIVLTFWGGIFIFEVVFFFVFIFLVR